MTFNSNQHNHLCPNIYASRSEWQAAWNGTFFKYKLTEETFKALVTKKKPDKIKLYNMDNNREIVCDTLISIGVKHMMLRASTNSNVKINLYY